MFNALSGKVERLKKIRRCVALFLPQCDFSATLCGMGRPLKLNTATAAAMVANAKLGLPIGRASALAGVHRCTAMRWLAQGAAEIDAAGDDEDGELTLRARFSIDFESARASYLLGLVTKWQERIDKQDFNTAKVVAAMMASQAPDEYSERRATRTQHTTLTGDVTVGRFDGMTDDDLHAERSKIIARRDAAQAGAAGADSWQAAAVRMPGQDKDEDQPERAAEEKTSTVENPKRSVSTRKPGTATKGFGDGGSPQNISPTRARVSGAPVVEAGRSDVQTDWTGSWPRMARVVFLLPVRRPRRPFPLRR